MKRLFYSRSVAAGDGIGGAAGAPPSYGGAGAPTRPYTFSINGGAGEIQAPDWRGQYASGIVVG